VVGLLQDGPAFASALQALAAQAQTTKLTVTVSSVLLQSPNTAVAIFTLFTNGTAVAKDTPGYAVREGGVWKVAGLTFCGLVSQNRHDATRMHDRAGNCTAALMQQWLGVDTSV
jgi:hypothetical protein